MSSYIVDTADLGSERLELEGVFPAGTLGVGLGVEQVGDVGWSGYLERQTGRIRFAGRLDGTLELACGRCLDPSRVDVAGEFDLFFEQRDNLEYEENAEIELEEPDMRTAFMTGTELNVGEVLTEQLLLAVPMKPLCRDDCRGLCAQCGQNLNIAACECSVPAVNPAFGVLQALKDRMARGDSSETDQRK